MKKVFVSISHYFIPRKFCKLLLWLPVSFSLNCFAESAFKLSNCQILNYVSHFDLI